MATAKTRNGTKPIPDAMTRQRWARRIAADLADTQEAKAQFEVTQFKHEHDLTDEVPGRPPKLKDDGVTYVIENGKHVYQTYGEIYAENDAAQARLWKFADQKGVTTLVEKMIDAELASEEEE